MKLENNKRKAVKSTNMWKLNNTFLNNQWAEEEIKREIKNYLETNENENTTYRNVWYAAKAVLRAKFIVINADIKKLEKSQIKKSNFNISRN